MAEYRGVIQAGLRVSKARDSDLSSPAEMDQSELFQLSMDYS